MIDYLKTFERSKRPAYADRIAIGHTASETNKANGVAVLSIIENPAGAIQQHRDVEW